MLEQADKSRLFEIGDRYNRGKFAFPHLYTALDVRSIKTFLGSRRVGIGIQSLPQFHESKKTNSGKSDAANTFRRRAIFATAVRWVAVFSQRRGGLETTVEKQGERAHRFDFAV